MVPSEGPHHSFKRMGEKNNDEPFYALDINTTAKACDRSLGNLIGWQFESKYILYLTADTNGNWSKKAFVLNAFRIYILYYSTVFNLRRIFMLATSWWPVRQQTLDKPQPCEPANRQPSSFDNAQLPQWLTVRWNTVELVAFLWIYMMTLMTRLDATAY